MGAVALHKNLDSTAFKLIAEAQKIADYDEALFKTPELEEQLLDLAKQTIATPTTVPSSRQEAYNLYQAFDEIVFRGLWQEPKFAEFTSSLLNHDNPKVKAIFIDCVRQSNLTNSYNSGEILNKNPKLLTQILDAAISSKSSTALAQTIEMFSNAGIERVTQANIATMLSAISKMPSAKVLTAGAYFFANYPDRRFSEILHSNINNIDDELKQDQSVLRYLLNHSPSAEVVRKTKEVGLDLRFDLDKYPGKTGILEAALYLERHRLNIGFSLAGLGNLFDRLINRRISPSNYSDQAAMRFIARNLKVGQPEYVVNVVFKALGSSHSNLALDYLNKVSTPPGFFNKLINTFTFSFSNICNNSLRLSAAFQGLKYNTAEQAQALKEKITYCLKNKVATDFFGWDK